ncbi:MAG: shikimate kinase [Chitinophagaceae bacterium]|nr:MAG: shikimate kinase [Chitinophagaceae bacterium]
MSKLFLIGMMGTGKTYWCKKLAKKLKVGGYDLDFLIESHEERTIAEIFAEEGEAYFRRAETKILHWFKEKKSFVLATGGGTPCFHENMQWMNEQGITVWIDEPVSVLAARLLPEKEHRPLIKDLSETELKQFLTDKLMQRYPFYHQATYHLQGDAISDAGFAKILKQHA